MRIATFNINGVNRRLANLLRMARARATRRRVPAGAQGGRQEFPAKARQRPATRRSGAASRPGTEWRSWRAGRDRSSAATGSTATSGRAEPLYRGGGERRAIACLYAPNGNPQARAQVRLQARLDEAVARSRRDAAGGRSPRRVARRLQRRPDRAAISIPRSRGTGRTAAAGKPRRVRRLLEQGWIDAVRTLHPEVPMYTFWDYMRNRWARDAGLRIDHLLLSRRPRASDWWPPVSIDGCAVKRARATTRLRGSSSATRPRAPSQSGRRGRQHASLERSRNSVKESQRC